LQCSKTAIDLHHITIPIDERDPQQSILAIDSPFIFVFHSKSNSVEIYPLNTSQLLSTYCRTLQGIRFNMAIPVSSSSLALRSVDTALKQNIISKVNLITNAIKKQPKSLDKQLDGFFCTDGLMKKDPITDRLLYMYYYRNLLVCLDSNLNILYKSHTIDSNTTAKLKIGEIKSSEFYTLAVPEVKVNQAVAIGLGSVFIKSGLLSDNENRQHFSKASVIDQYLESTGAYEGSFYIPDFSGFKISDFRILGNTLITLQGHYLVTYSLLNKRATILHPR